MNDFEQETRNLSESFTEFLFEPNPQQGGPVSFEDLGKSVESVKTLKTNLKTKKEAHSYLNSVKKRLNRLEKRRIDKMLRVINAEEDLKNNNQSPWSRRDLLTLMCRVFKFGENEWDVDLVNELDQIKVSSK